MASAIDGLDNLFRRIGQLTTDIRQIERPMKAASVYMLGSIQKNFSAQGRPQKWQALAPSTVKRRRKGSSSILQDTGRLKNSMTYRLTGAGSEIGTNVKYAPRQHFGYPGGSGRGRSKTPARPFLLFQKDDVDAIGKIFARHISGI